MKYAKKLIGNKCYLSPLSLDDAPFFYQCLNDSLVSMNTRAFAKMITLDIEKEMLSQLIKDNRSRVFGIINAENDEIIGTCGLMSIDFADKSAEMGIMIGNRNFHNKGYGKDAIMLILDYAFYVLNIHSVHLSVIAYNPYAIKLYEKCGFKHIGRLREAKIIGEQKFDIVCMDILSHEHESVYVKNLIK